MEICDIIKTIKEGTSIERINAEGELLRRTNHWKDPNPNFKGSIFTQICYKYNINNNSESVSEMLSIYDVSISRIIVNIKKGNLDEIHSQSAFEAYSKEVCAKLCLEWTKTEYKGGMKLVPVYINKDRAYLISINGDYERCNDGNGELKVFENKNQAKKYIDVKGSGKLIPMSSINDEIIEYQLDNIISKVRFTGIPVDDVLIGEESGELSSYEEKILEEFVGIHRRKISNCRNIFTISAIHSKPSNQFIAWKKIEGNENKANTAFRKKKADCKRKLLEKIERDPIVRCSKTFLELIDRIYGEDISLFVQ